jgi:hypothetical protein
MGFPRRAGLGFVCGALSVPIFHQVALALLRAAGLTPRAPFSMQPTAPLGVPLVLSLAFWGGIWGVVLVTTDRRLPRGGASLLAGALFGALAPTLVSWFVAAPLKDQPLAAGGDPRAMLTAVLVNAAWGAGTALLLLLAHRLEARRPPEGSGETVAGPARGR